MMKKEKKKPMFFRFLQSIAKSFTTKYTFDIKEELKKDGCIIISNHAQMGGPLAYQLYYPRKKKIWCIGEMFDKKEFPDYAMKDFWPNKKKSRWFYKGLSKTLAPLSQYIFKYTDTIPVYKDTRYYTTAKQSIKAMTEGNDIIIMPEEHVPFNNIVNEFLQNFVSVAQLYHAKTKKTVYFYPNYVAPKCKKVIIGTPIEFNPDNDFNMEKKRICEYLKEEITKLAYTLPPHTVVPYENISKKQYPHT